MLIITVLLTTEQHMKVRRLEKGPAGDFQRVAVDIGRMLARQH